MTTFDAHANLALGVVATAPSPAASGITLTLSSGQGALMPTAPFNAVVWPVASQPTASTAEIVRVTGVTGDVLTMTRGPQAGDPGGITRSILVGDQVAAAITRKTFTDIESAIAALAPLASPAFTGVPTAPTATAGTNTTQVATTAFVQTAVTGGTAGVSSFNTRTGAVTLTKADVTGTGLAAADVGADASGAAASAQSASLQKASNLSDLASAATARTNLGLGTAAVAAIDVTATDIAMNGVQAAGATGKVADAGHVHPMPRLDQVAAPTAAVAVNGQKITGLANGTVATDGAAFGQIPNPKTAKQVVFPIAADTSGTSGTGTFTGALQRWLLAFPDAPTQMRLRIANTGLAGAITLDDIYVGTPTYSNGAWSGSIAASPTKVLTAPTLPSDGTELVTSWFDPTALWSAADKAMVLSIDFSCANTVNLQKSSNMGFCRYRTTGGLSGEVAATSPALGSLSNTTQFLDIRVEAQFSTNLRVVLVLGDSTAIGYNDTGDAPNLPGPMNTWPWQLMLKNRVLCINAAVGGKATSDYTSSTDAKYTRVLSTAGGSTPTVPDDILINLGINDANSGTTLATYKTNLNSVITAAKSLASATARVWVATILQQPRWKPGTILAGQASAGTANGTVSTTSVTGWAGTGTPVNGMGVSGGGFTAGSTISAVAGSSGNWSFTVSSSGTAGAQSLTVGSLTLQTSVAYANGDVVDVDYEGVGGTKETALTVNGASAGTQAPYTTTFTNPTARSHSVGSTINLSTTESRRLDYNQHIRKLPAQVDGVFLIDAATAQPGSPNVGDPRFWYGGATIHPGANAYAAIANAISIPKV